MKTKNAKLNFEKHSVVELTDNNMNQIKGGNPTTTVTVSSWLCSAAVSLFTQFEIDFNYDAH